MSTPTTDEVRQGFVFGQPDGSSDARAAEWDAWLTEHDRKIAAGALREAADEIEANADPMGGPDPRWLVGMESAARRVRDRADRIDQGDDQ